MPPYWLDGIGRLFLGKEFDRTLKPLQALFFAATKHFGGIKIVEGRAQHHARIIGGELLSFLGGLSYFGAYEHAFHRTQADL